MKSRHENEYHKEIQKKRTRFWLLAGIIAFFSLIFCGCIIYILFFSSIFVLHNVHVQGNKYIETSSLQKSILYLKGKNIFFAQVNTSSLMDKFPLIQGVDVVKEYPASIAVVVHEYPPFFLLQTPHDTQVLSSNGLVIDSVPNASTKYSLPLVLIGQNGIANVPLKEIAAFVGAIEQDKKDFVTNFSFALPSELTAHYADGHSILFSLNKSISAQVSEMYRVRDLVGFSKCKNLDVRFDNIYCSGS